MNGPTEAPATDRRVSRAKTAGKYMTAASHCDHAAALAMEAYVGCEAGSRARAQWAIEEASRRLEAASEALADVRGPSTQSAWDAWTFFKNLVKGDL